MSALKDIIRNDAPTYDEANDYERICLLRRWVYEHSMVASTVDTLTEREPEFGSMAPMEFYEIFQKGRGGLWCHGTAHFLRGVYAAMGFEAYAFSYGMPGSTTHTTTLVSIGDALYMQDAYFNCCHVDKQGRPLTFFSLLKALGDRKPVLERKEEIVLRPVLAMRPSTCWTNADNADPSVWSRHDGAIGGWIGRFHTSFDVFQRHIFSSEDSKRQLAEEGLPTDLAYLALYPLWMHDGNRMYGEDRDSGELLGAVEEYAGKMRKKAASRAAASSHWSES